VKAGVNDQEKTQKGGPTRDLKPNASHQQKGTLEHTGVEKSHLQKLKDWSTTKPGVQIPLGLTESGADGERTH